MLLHADLVVCDGDGCSDFLLWLWVHGCLVSDYYFLIWVLDLGVGSGLDLEIGINAGFGDRLRFAYLSEWYFLVFIRRFILIYSLFLV